MTAVVTNGIDRQNSIPLTFSVRRQLSEKLPGLSQQCWLEQCWLEQCWLDGG